MATYTIADNNVATCKSETIDALINEVQQEFSALPEAEQTTSEDTCEVTPVTHNKADAALSMLLHFSKQQEGTEAFLGSLEQMHNFMEVKHLKELQQSKTTKWFGSTAGADSTP